MSVKVLLAALLSLFLGFLLGSTPGLNEHLHWNLGYIIPVSGLIFGCLCAGLQFWMCFSFHVHLVKIVIVYLTLATMTGYVAIDYGIYRSMTVEITDHEQIQDGEYKLKDLMSFGHFMKLNLGYSSVETESGSTLEYSAVGTTLSYLADLVGAGLGSVGIFVLCMGKYPYCIPCGKYKKRQKKYVIQFVSDAALRQQIMDRFEDLVELGDTAEMASCCQQLSTQHCNPKGKQRISIDHRVCPSCRTSTMLGVFEQQNSGTWNEVKELSFTFLSKDSTQVSNVPVHTNEESASTDQQNT